MRALPNPLSDQRFVMIGATGLDAELTIPVAAKGLVVFVHGSGSSRNSPRNRSVAAVLQRHHLATLLFDLLTATEAADPVAHNTFNIGLLAGRAIEALLWAERNADTRHLRVGLFGASTGAAAALVAAAQRANQVRAVVSRGGRPDLASAWLGRVKAPTLLVVGGLDLQVLAWNRQALRQLVCTKRLEVVPGAGHLFEEPGAMSSVAALAAEWFQHHLCGDRSP